MIKALKNIIQTNQDIYSCLNDEMRNRLKYICNKYHIFDSIIEEKEEQQYYMNIRRIMIIYYCTYLFFEYLNVKKIN